MSLLVSSRVLERGGNKTWLHGLRLQLCITIQSRIGSAVLAVRTLASLRNNSRSSISMVNILGIVIRLGWNAYWPYGGSRVVPVVFLFLDSLPFLEKSRLLNDMISTSTSRSDYSMSDTLVCTYFGMNGVKSTLSTLDFPTFHRAALAITPYRNHACHVVKPIFLAFPLP